MREVISEIRTSPDRRCAIISDLYRLHCDGIKITLIFFFYFFMLCAEVVLSKNEEILHTMIESGLLEMLVDIMSSNFDPDTLV